MNVPLAGGTSRRREDVPSPAASRCVVPDLWIGPVVGVVFPTSLLIAARVTTNLFGSAHADATRRI